MHCILRQISLLQSDIMTVHRPQWIIAKTQGGQEAYAASNVERQERVAYFPRFHCARRKKIAAIYPGYLFVMTENKQWSFLESTYGVRGVIMGTDGPTTVPHRVIRALKEQFGKDGLGVMPSLSFRRGTSVHVHSGFLAGTMGIVEGSTTQDRVKLLLDICGRDVHIELETKFLRAA